MVPVRIQSIYVEVYARVADLFVGFLVLGEGVQAENGEDVHILVTHHETDVAQAAYRLKSVLGYLSPEDQVDENLGDFLERFQIDVLGSQARNDDRVQALLVQDLLEILLIL